MSSLHSWLRFSPCSIGLMMKKVPGTSMPMGVASPKDRADLIAYLATLTAEKGTSVSPSSAGLAFTGSATVVAAAPAQGTATSRP